MYIKGTGKFTDIMSPSKTPLVMTRPGLFGNDYVVILYADGHVEGFDASSRNKKNENSEKPNSDGTHRITMNVTPTEGENAAKGFYLVELKIFEKDKTGKETVLTAPKVIITEGTDAMITMAEEPSGDGLHCKVTSAKIDDNNLEVKVTAYQQLDGKKTFELSELQKIKRKAAK
jgi:prepilin-type processing-associated H-X9-DG protein